MGVIRTAAAKARQEERTERRRTQILDAARACVRAEGFHAASVGRIAAEASVSVGHIYQYFESKEAVMIALSERDLEDFMSHLMQSDDGDTTNVDAVIQTLVSRIMWLMSYERAALALDVMTEASRNAKVADLVLSTDRRIRAAVRAIIGPILADQSEKQMRICIETILLITRALVVHAGTHRISDPGDIAAGLERSFRGLLSYPDQSVSGS